MGSSHVISQQLNGFFKKGTQLKLSFCHGQSYQNGESLDFLTVTKYITNLIIFSLLPLSNQWHRDSNWAGGSDHNRFRTPNLFFPTVTIVIYLSLVLLRVPKFHVRPLILYTEIYLLFFHNFKRWLNFNFVYSFFLFRSILHVTYICNHAA